MPSLVTPPQSNPARRHEPLATKLHSNAKAHDLVSLSPLSCPLGRLFLSLSPLSSRGTSVACPRKKKDGLKITPTPGFKRPETKKRWKKLSPQRALGRAQHPRNDALKGKPLNDGAVHDAAHDAVELALQRVEHGAAEQHLDGVPARQLEPRLDGRDLQVAGVERGGEPMQRLERDARRAPLEATPRRRRRRRRRLTGLLGREGGAAGVDALGRRGHAVRARHERVAPFRLGAEARVVQVEVAHEEVVPAAVLEAVRPS